MTVLEKLFALVGEPSPAYMESMIVRRGELADIAEQIEREMVMRKDKK